MHRTRRSALIFRRSAAALASMSDQRRTSEPHHPHTPLNRIGQRLKAGTVAAAIATPVLLASPGQAFADVSVIQMPTVVPGSLPLRVTLLFAEDEQTKGARHYTVPATLAVTITSGDVPPKTLTLTRAAGAPAALNLRANQFRRVTYTAAWPDGIRGTLRVQVADFNAAPALVTLDQGKKQGETVAENRTAQSGGPATLAATDSPTPAPGASAAIPASDASIASKQVAIASTGPESRLSFYEPMYFGIGTNGHTTARFQLSFKYRVVTPKDPRSKGFFDNLYFGYTQVSIWDLTEESKPFRDTSYKPSLFYYLPDVGLKSRWFDSLGFQGGIEHESNGASGDTSRSINIAYVKPIIHFKTPYSTELTVAPKIYYYLQKSENSDIAAYRGYTDLEVRYGRPDGLELFTVLRKGTHAWNGSVDTQLTYPMQKLFGGGVGGYLWLGYFNGYGPSLLDYNDRQHWVVRVGYSIYR
jgi:outer membrane phospholipase A